MKEYDTYNITKKELFMQMELVGLYPLPEKKKGKRRGTAHFYFPDLDIDLRGVYYLAGPPKSNFLFIRIPHLHAIDEGKKVQFPVMTFTKEENYLAMINKMRELVRAELKLRA